MLSFHMYHGLTLIISLLNEQTQIRWKLQQRIVPHAPTQSRT